MLASGGSKGAPSCKAVVNRPSQHLRCGKHGLKDPGENRPCKEGCALPSRASFLKRPGLQQAPTPPPPLVMRMRIVSCLKHSQGGTCLTEYITRPCGGNLNL